MCTEWCVLRRFYVTDFVFTWEISSFWNVACKKCGAFLRRFYLRDYIFPWESSVCIWCGDFFLFEMIEEKTLLLTNHVLQIASLSRNSMVQKATDFPLGISNSSWNLTWSAAARGNGQQRRSSNCWHHFRLHLCMFTTVRDKVVWHTPLVTAREWRYRSAQSHPPY